MSDLTERLRNIGNRLFATRGRPGFDVISTIASISGVGGQTVEAVARATMHQISAWDAEAFFEAAAEIERLQARVARLEEALHQCLGSLKALGAEKGYASEAARAALLSEPPTGETTRNEQP